MSDYDGSSSGMLSSSWLRWRRF